MREAIDRVQAWPMRWCTLPLLAVLLLVGCRPTSTSPGQPSVPRSDRVDAAAEQRLQRLELRLQQLEQRLADPDAADTADRAGKPPAGPVKSLTFRMGTQDDRLRIYWADGTSSDLPCTKEQATWACG
jgi:hypothetical protein